MVEFAKKELKNAAPGLHVLVNERIAVHLMKLHSTFTLEAAKNKLS